MKKGISIALLLLYIMVNFMPYIPYIYAATHHHKTDLNKSEHTLSTSSCTNTGDICYLKAITKRSAENKETKTPQVIIVNNLEFTPLCKKINFHVFLVKDFHFIEYKANLVNHIKRPNTPPPKFIS